MSTRTRKQKIWKEAAGWYARMAEPVGMEEVAQFETWLGLDPAHARAYAEMDAVMSAAGTLSPEVGKARRPRHLVPRPALAFLLLALALVTAVVLSQASAAPAFAAISNSGPAVRQVRLADGTAVWLDAGAQIGVRMGQASREIAVRAGRVRILPALNTRSLQVSVRGAHIRPGGSRIDVSVTSDAAAVGAIDGPLTLNASSRATSVRLASGQAIAFDAHGSHPAEIDRTWPASKVCFAASPLGQILALANHSGDIEVVAADDHVAALRVSGVLDLRDGRRLARKLAATLDLRVAEEQDKIVLRR